MLVSLFKWLEATFGDFPGNNLLDFLSVRAGIAIILSLVISMIFGGRVIKWLQRMQMGESVRDLGLAGQAQKAGTPTMGGVIILMAILIPCLLMGVLTNTYLITMLVATVWMGAE